MRRLAVGLILSFLPSTAWAACGVTSLSFKDAAGATQVLCFGGVSGAYLPQHQIVDSTGANIASVSAAGAVKVDGSAVTQPVSGTFWQATQPVSGTVAATESGTWTVQPGNTANTTPWLATINQGGNTAGVTIGGALKVDGSAVTQPVSGTFWQATQPVSGTVTANQGGTWTVQPGNTANTTAWLVDGNVGNSTDAVATSSTNLTSNGYNYGFNGTTWDRLRVDASKNLNVNCQAGCAGGAFNNNADAVATSATNGQAAAWLYGFNGTTWDRLRVDGSKNLDVNLNASAATVTVSGTVTTTPPSNASTNVTQFGGTAISTGTGAGGLGIPRVTLSNDSSLAANQSVNVAQFGGTTLVTGTGLSASGVPRVTVSSDSSLAANQSVNTNQFGGNAVVTGTGAGGLGIPRVTVSSDSSLAANQSVNMNQVAGTTLVADPCQTVAKVYTPISITVNTRIVTGTASKKTYICAINLTAPNNNVALVEGTGTVCATGIAGVAGGTTAATGWNFANATAPGVGITQGNGRGAIMATATNADDLCLLVSAATQVSGQIVTVQQ